MTPRATYRLQLTPDFPFAAAARVIPYLADLGITHVYLSPVLGACPGSRHGYDGTDPTRARAELGGAKGFGDLARSARDAGLALLIDLVPNHMAASPDNAWFRDVLEAGSRSPFAMWFDIDWERSAEGRAGRIVYAVLDEPPRAAIAARRIRVELRRDGFAVVLDGPGLTLPLHPRTWRTILELHLAQLAAVLGPRSAAYRALLDIAESAGTLRDSMEAKASSIQELEHSRRALATRLRHLAKRHREIEVYLEEILRVINGGEKNADAGLLEALIGEQGYELASWRTDAHRVNYRRYLDHNDLIAVRVEEPEVFRQTHELPLWWYRSGDVAGFRIDHVDGLLDPEEYLARLRAACKEGAPDVPPAREPWILVESMLAPGAALPEGFQADGTTGYDFLNAVTRVLVDPEGLDELDVAYRSFASRPRFLDASEAEKRMELLTGDFAPHVARLAELFESTAARRAAPFDRERLTFALACLTAHLAAARTFLTPERAPPRAARSMIGAAVAGAIEAGADAPILNAIAERLYNTSSDAFWSRWQSFCLLVHVRAIEEIDLWRDQRLLALNEPGGATRPARADLQPAAFHRAMDARAAAMPHTLNATSTHDTRRSEDVRARLAVLSDMAVEFARAARRWQRWNRPFKRRSGRVLWPDPNFEWMLYQTLVAAWPLRDDDLTGFVERIKAHARKAVREARLHTSWVTPSTGYEDAVIAFVDGILHPAAASPFLADFRSFARVVAERGAWNSLLQLVLKMTAPGVPDVYQGQELWDFSLTDPDNRRPIDFGQRHRLLRELDARARRDGRTTLVDALSASWRDGRIKLWFTRECLRLRGSYPDVFDAGTYVPLEVSGGSSERRGRTIAFARRHEDRWVVVVGCRDVGGETIVELPVSAPRGAWQEFFSGHDVETLRRSAGRLTLAPRHALSRLPVAVLVSSG